MLCIILRCHRAKHGDIVLIPTTFRPWFSLVCKPKAIIVAEVVSTFNTSYLIATSISALFCGYIRNLTGYVMKLSSRNPPPSKKEGDVLNSLNLLLFMAFILVRAEMVLRFHLIGVGIKKLFFFEQGCFHFRPELSTPYSNPYKKVIDKLLFRNQHHLTKVFGHKNKRIISTFCCSVFLL